MRSQELKNKRWGTGPQTPAKPKNLALSGLSENDPGLKAKLEGRLLILSGAPTNNGFVGYDVTPPGLMGAKTIAYEVPFPGEFGVLTYVKETAVRPGAKPHWYVTNSK